MPVSSSSDRDSSRASRVGMNAEPQPRAQAKEAMSTDFSDREGVRAVLHDGQEEVLATERGRTPWGLTTQTGRTSS